MDLPYPGRDIAAVELQWGAVHVSRYSHERMLYAIVWDTHHGHVIYPQGLDDTRDYCNQLTVHAAELIEPRWWSSTVVLTL